MPVLECSNLCLKLQGRILLSEASFSVEPGDIALLAGCNGSGKTTLLKCLVRLYENWGGDIFFDGVPLRALSRRQLARSIAYMPQRMEALPDFTAEHFMKVCRYAWDDDGTLQIAEAAKRVGITHLLEQRVPILSGGELTRVMLASAMAQEAKLLLLDEPTAALDPVAKGEILAILADFAKQQGTAIIMASHDVEAASQYADYVLPLKQGRMLSPMAPSIFLDNMKEIY